MQWWVTGQLFLHISLDVHCELGQVVHIKGSYFTWRMAASGSKPHLLQVAYLRGEAAVEFVGDKWLLRPRSKITALLLNSGFSFGKKLYTHCFTQILGQYANHSESSFFSLVKLCWRSNICLYKWGTDCSRLAGVFLVWFVVGFFFLFCSGCVYHGKLLQRFRDQQA